MEGVEYKTEIIKDNNVKNDLFAKVEVIGDLKVGKTSIIKRLIHDTFITEYTPTQGYEFNPYLVKVNDTIIKLQIWDMCGSDNYRAVLLNLYRNAKVGILVYDVTSRESFNNLEKWIEDLKEVSYNYSKIILIGNKSDETEKRAVSYEEGQEMCKNNELEFFAEVSAKNGFTSPNFLELIAINLVKEYEHNKDDSDILNSVNESIMLGQANNSKAFGKCC